MHQLFNQKFKRAWFSIFPADKSFVKILGCKCSLTAQYLENGFRFSSFNCKSLLMCLTDPNTCHISSMFGMFHRTDCSSAFLQCWHKVDCYYVSDCSVSDPWLFAFKGYCHNSISYRISIRAVSGHLEFISVSKRVIQTRLHILNSQVFACLQIDFFQPHPWSRVAPVKNWLAENCQLILVCPLQRRMSAWASFESEAGRHIDRPCPQYTYRLPSTTPVTQPRFYADNFVIGSQLKIFSDWLCELQQLPLSALSLMAFLIQVWDWAVCSVHQLLSLSICSWCQALVAFDPACFGLVIQTRKCVLFHTGPPKEHLQQKKISSC